MSRSPVLKDFRAIKTILFEFSKLLLTRPVFELFSLNKVKQKLLCHLLVISLKKNINQQKTQDGISDVQSCLLSMIFLNYSLLFTRSRLETENNLVPRAFVLWEAKVEALGVRLTMYCKVKRSSLSKIKWMAGKLRWN